MFHLNCVFFFRIADTCEYVAETNYKHGNVDSETLAACLEVSLELKSDENAYVSSNES